MKFLKSIKTKDTESLLSDLIQAQKNVEKQPALSELGQAQMEHSTDIGHLYYSSKIEGTKLTKQQIEKAINDPSTVSTS
jgi:hypothetical protein